MGCGNNQVTIDGLVRIEIKFSDSCEVTQIIIIIIIIIIIMRQLPRGFVVGLYKTYVRMCISLIIKDLCTLFK